MATYTMQLRDVIRMVNGNISNDIESDIKKAIPRIFNFPVNIWLDGYEEVIFTKFCERFYMREICAETYPLWQLFLKRHIQLVMPYYNNIYKTTIYEFDPNFNVDMLTTHIGKDTDNININRNGENLQTHSAIGNVQENSEDIESRNSKTNSTDTISKESSETIEYGKTTNVLRTPDILSRTETNGESTSNTNTHNIDSDFPNSKANSVSLYGSNGTDGTTSNNTNDSTVSNTRESGNENTTTTESGTDTKKTTGNDTETENYKEEHTLSRTGRNVTDSTENTNISGTTKETDIHDRKGTNEYETRVKGNDGRYTLANLIKEYREILINIDEMFLNDCEKLFMSIW